jgi:hypothetical protein
MFLFLFSEQSLKVGMSDGVNGEVVGMLLMSVATSTPRSRTYEKV